eukprot:CAMPEP_0178916696 /NCGR_PEP_ID=MMETSP0786-20121207/12802_1 /TAXON_ID=186022 /ORGANISM="Thalassionema frauenfeldii, Strain CCMP 1798" /LENGTH=44 /DNA_ID= /DNA_START= /DNA_END= /DNA_ORIENTATION=
MSISIKSSNFSVICNWDFVEQLGLPICVKLVKGTLGDQALEADA